MPIPNQASVDHLGFPALTGSNKTLHASYEPRQLRTGVPCVFIDSSGTRHTVIMGAVRADLTPPQINVTLTIAGRRTELTGIPYDDTPGGLPYTWRFASDG